MYLHVSRRVFFENTIRTLAALLLEQAAGQSSSEKKTDSTEDKNGSSEKKSEDKGDEKVYEPGGDIKPPKLLHYVEPAFSAKSKEAFVEGTVKISTVVTTEGVASDCKVVSGLNAEEDRTAVEALKQWKFQPGTKNGQPVNVRVTVEVSFHLL